METALTRMNPGNTLNLKDGVYSIENATPLNMGPAGSTVKSTIQAAPGARPVITRDDGYPPRIQVNQNTKITGVWFGGAKADADRPITMGDNVELLNNTFFGYYGAVVEGGNSGCTYQGNRFVNCGDGSQYHGIYISNGEVNQATAAQILENIFLGGEGYQVHLWSGADWAYVYANFVAEAQWVHATSGENHRTTRNIFWQANCTGPIPKPIHFDASADIDWHENFHGDDPSGWHSVDGAPDWYGVASLPAGVSLANNFYMAQAKADGGGTSVSAGEESGYLGKTQAQIDTAVSALLTSFGEATTTIQADATIETNFTVLSDAIDNWKAYTI